MKMTKNELRKMKDGVKVRSMTNPDKTYTVKLIVSKFPENRGKLMLACSCPAWKFNHGGKRVCKHIKKFLEENVHPNTRRRLEKGLEAGLLA